MKILEWFRWALGLTLLDWALSCLPSGTGARIGVIRGLSEQRAYDRYWAYCSLLSQPALPFDRWREQLATMAVKVASSSHRQDSAIPAGAHQPQSGGAA